MSKSQIIDRLIKVTDLGGMSTAQAKKALGAYSEDQLSGMLATAQKAATKKSSAKKSSAKKSVPKTQAAKKSSKKKSAAKTTAPKRVRKTPAQKKVAAQAQAKAKAQAQVAAKAAAQAQAAAKAAAQAQKAAAQAAAKASGKKSSTKKKSGVKRTSAAKTGAVKRSLPKQLVSRARSLAAAIERGAIAAKQGKKSAADMAGGTRREQYEKFVAIYDGVRTKGVRKGGPKSVGIVTRYKELSGSKRPYFLSPGYHVPGYDVGGGKRGPGIVRTLPGSKARSFAKLEPSEQQKVCTFLNGTGSTLRSKGAPKQAACAEIRRHMAGGSAKKKASSQKRAAAGGANRW